jgi:hypothetical protein
MRISARRLHGPCGNFRSWHSADIEAARLRSAFGFHSDVSAKMLNFTEDAHIEIMRTLSPMSIFRRADIPEDSRPRAEVLSDRRGVTLSAAGQWPGFRVGRYFCFTEFWRLAHGTKRRSSRRTQDTVLGLASAFSLAAMGVATR